MSNYNSLKTAIDANIKQNGKQEITGPVLNSVLNAMVDTLGAGYQFAGIAVSDTNPGTPDAKVFYIANGKGAYTNFSGLDVTEDEVVVFYYDTEWHKVSTGIASQAKLSELQTIVDSKQDTISDLDDIREGAALGKTALQEHQDISGLATKKEVATKQDKISDLDTIRSGAAKGATALQSYTETDPVYMADKPNIALKKEIPDISGKQDKISDLESIREGAALGKTALQSYTESDPIYKADKPSIALKSELDGKQDKLTAGDNITIVNNVISSTGGGGGSVDLSAYAKTVDVNASLATKQDKISDLDDIREGAAKGATALQSYTETDPIYSADKPSIALKSELDGKQDKLTAGDNITIVNNVISSTGGGGGSVDLSAYAKTVDVNASLATKQDKISDLDDIREGAAKGATALQSYTETDPIYSADKPSIALKSELNGKQDKISDLESIREGAALGKTALQEHQDISKLATKEEVATKQDKISDLATIREGAAKGATALQSYTETDPIYKADKPSLALKSEIPDISGKQDKISDLDTIRSGAAKGATALQSYTETDPVYTADKPTIAFKRDIPDISGKADKTVIVTETAGNSSYRIAPNRLTRLGTLASNVTLSLNTTSEEAGVVNVYDIIFTTPATNAPSITWPDGITWAGGSAPAIAGGKTYEVSIMDGLATYGEFSV